MSDSVNVMGVDGYMTHVYHVVCLVHDSVVRR